MFGIYFSPTRTFERLKQRPVWLVPLIVVVVANLAVTALAIQYVDWEAQREAAVERMQERGMTEEQIEQATERMSAFYDNPMMKTVFPIVGALVTQVIGILFLTVVFNLGLPLLGASGNFKRSLSVVAYGSLVAVPGAVVRAVLILLRRSAEVSTSLLVAFPNLKQGFLAVVLSRIDVFVVWQFALFGLGLKVAFDTKGNKSYWLVFGVWVLITLVLAALSLLSGNAPR
ncbi:MAG: YIP1 family protein [candidate division WOR-3 bacterium]|nr:MAG: YIP1 family protein [candidate division WOR-3 bacterium]